MLYYLALELTQYVDAFNAFTYHTVRAGLAWITAFVFCLIFGPTMIRAFRVLKFGQQIKQDHVQDLHALHKSKAGTPTMGGAIMIAATLFSVLMWSTLTNRLVIIAVIVMCLMGGVGFLDDYIKIKRKHNDGLSAKAKLTGQILSGLVLGLFMVLTPITFGASYLSGNDIKDWSGLTHSMDSGENAALNRFVQSFSPALRTDLAGVDIAAGTRRKVIDELNEAFERRDIYAPEVFPGVNGETTTMLAKGVDKLNNRELVRLNRLLFETAAPHYVTKSPRKLHTSVGIPGIKDVLIPLGMFYVLFVILILVGASNAVNLTDGLDGLAAGASIISILAFTTIAYVVSRADWSEYLYLSYVPEASELTVFGGAMLGAGLGFLWFNAHPAEVFMGDTGSLALGGVIGTMAVLTKQELLLPIVGGLFVLEAMSVIIQVASFKLRGKRVFRMAPLHHHFELKGWSEIKVTIRFWIIALVFLLLSLSTLKLR